MIRVLSVLLILISTSAWGDPIRDWIKAQDRDHRRVLTNMRADETLQTLSQLCPADVFLRQTVPETGSANCKDNPGWCLSMCRTGRGKSCFGLARAIQTEMEDVGEATFTFPAFMAACASGHPNGCTNAGAAAKNGSWIPGTRPKAATTRSCQFRTYDAACSAGATWGCFMLGLEWGVEGVNGQTNQAKARAAWQRSCRLQPNGSACEASKSRLSDQ